MLIPEAAQTGGQNSSASQIAYNLALIGAIDHGQAANVEAAGDYSARQGVARKEKSKIDSGAPFSAWRTEGAGIFQFRLGAIKLPAFLL